MIKIFKLSLIIGFIFTITTYTYSQDNGIGIKWYEGINDYGHGIINLGKTNKYMLIQKNNDKPDIVLLSLNDFSVVKQLKSFTPKVKKQILTYEKSIVFNNRLIVVANDSIKQFVLKYNIPDLKLIEVTEIGNVEPILESFISGQESSFSIKNTISPIEFIKTNKGNRLHVLFNQGLGGRIGYTYLSINKDNTEKITNNYFEKNIERFEILQNLITDRGVLYTIYRGHKRDGKFIYFLGNGSNNQTTPIELKINVNHLRLVENQEHSISIVGEGNMDKKELFFDLKYYYEDNRFGELMSIELDESQRSSLLKSKIESENLDASHKELLLMENYSIDGVKQINDELRLIYGENYSFSHSKYNKTNIIRHEAKEIYVCVYSNAGELVFFKTFMKYQVFENKLDRKPSWGSYIFSGTDSTYSFIYSGERIKKKDLIIDTEDPFKPTGKASNMINIVVTKDFEFETRICPEYSSSGIFFSPFTTLVSDNGEIIFGSVNNEDELIQKYSFGLYKHK